MVITRLPRGGGGGGGGPFPPPDLPGKTQMKYKQFTDVIARTKINI